MPKPWFAAILLFVAMSLPVGLFVLKNYVTKKDYAFERWIPFSAPLLPMSRLDQAKAELRGETALRHNLRFVRHGFNDNISWFQVQGVHPLPKIIIGLAGVGIFWEFWMTIRQRRFLDPFLPWLIACTPMFVLFPLNISRAIAFFLPVIVLAGVGFDRLLWLAKTPKQRLAIAALCVALLVGPTVHFVSSYYGPAYQDEVASTFYPEMPTALDRVQAMGNPQMPVYVSENILLNYVDVLFYLKVDPRVFQASGATWNKPDFGRFRFSRGTALESSKPFAFLLAHGEPALCSDPAQNQKVGALLIGICP